MTIAYRPAKMFISLVGRHRGEQLVAIAKAAGARGGTIGLGRSVGDNPILRALALADVQQDILFLVLGSEKERVLTAIRKAAKDTPKKLGGLAMVLDVSGMMVRPQNPEQAQHAPGSGAGSDRMESGYALITVITNSGFADDVMAAARKAGATGGTITTARGTGTEEDVKFFGITLVPEKDMLLIVAANDNVQGIIKAISSVPSLCEPGGGIVFTQNVEEFIVLGQ